MADALVEYLIARHDAASMGIRVDTLPHVDNDSPAELVEYAHARLRAMASPQSIRALSAFPYTQADRDKQRTTLMVGGMGVLALFTKAMGVRVDLVNDLDMSPGTKKICEECIRAGIELVAQSGMVTK